MLSDQSTANEKISPFNSSLEAHLRLHAGKALPEVANALGLNTGEALVGKAFGDAAVGDVDGALTGIWLVLFRGML